jgi:hypothetical protein
VRLDALTGLTDGQRGVLVERVVEYLGGESVVASGGRPSALGLEGSVFLVVTLLRANLTQDQAAAIFDVSQATASRRWDLLREPIAVVLSDVVPAVPDVVGTEGSVLVDGTLCPTWDWSAAEGMFSGKHEETGFNVQIAASLDGDIVAVGAPIPGARHDAHAVHASGLAGTVTGHGVVGDKGYQGHVDLSPIKKPAGASLCEHDKQYNREINSLRAAVERAIAHLKNWKILATGFRPPLEKFAATLRAVTGLYFLKKAYE